MTVETGTLDLQEAVAAPPKVQGDGTVLLQLIRPCVGRGKGRHVYEPGMLKEHAHVFAGWKMYVDHQTDAERKARGGLPRSVKDLGGVVMESYWDDNVPAEGRFGRGAVMGKVRAIDAVAELVKLHPSLVESSINARATGVKPVEREGSRAWLVEGIEPQGTVDWVTEGGAGGKVVSLLEAAVTGTPEEQEDALLDSMTDEEVRERLQAERPGVFLAEAAAAAEAPPAKGENDTAEFDRLVAKYCKSGMSEPMAKKAARAKLDAAKTTQEAAAATPVVQPETPSEGGDVAKPTAEDIQEALVTSPEVAQLVRDLVEQRLTEVRTEIEEGARAQAYADTDRLIEIRDLRDAAHQQIREARLPAAFQERALAEFDIVEGTATPALDVWEDIDPATGDVTATAMDVLRESVAEVIEAQRGLVASLKPTRVTGQGPRVAAGDKKIEEGAEKPDLVGPLTRQLLVEAGFSDPDKVYETVGG